jgi:hypothetical protein
MPTLPAAWSWPPLTVVGLQCDIGSNINVTADRSILCNYIALPEPFDLHGADASAQHAVHWSWWFSSSVSR